MSFFNTLDWKLVVAFGGVVVGTIFAVKMEPAAVERVSIRVIDAFGGSAIALNSGC